LLPFLVHPSYLGLPSSWIRTKEYMTPTEIDKAAGKRYGYVPDYSIWLGGIPLVIVEAKAPDVAIEVGLREARLYAGEINKRYPPEVNPIGFILASNGVQFGLLDIAMSPPPSFGQATMVGLFAEKSQAIDRMISSCWPRLNVP
jgi:type I site-specific restriction endonuclease